MAKQTASATIPDSPLLAKLTEGDRQTVQNLYQKCPHLRTDFCTIIEFLEQLSKDSWAYKSLCTLLSKIYNTVSYKREDSTNISLFASAIGFVSPCVEFQRQIMQEMNKEYLTELQPVDGKGVITEWSKTCLYLTRSCFLNFSSIGMEFRQRLADSGILQDLLEDAKHLKHLTAEALQSGNIFLLSVGTIDNCSRNPNVVPILRQLGAVDHLIPFLEKGEKSLAKATALMCLAYLVEPTDFQVNIVELSPQTLQYFLERVDGALLCCKDGHDGWVTVEVLDGLAVLANNDFNKRLIVAAGKICLGTHVDAAALARHMPGESCSINLDTRMGSLKTLMTVLKRTRRPEDEKKATLKLLAALAQDQHNAQVFKRYGDLVKLLKNLQRETSETVSELANTLLALLAKEVSDSQVRSSVLEELMADCLNTLSILEIGDVEYVLDQLSVVCKGNDRAAEGISVQGLLRALADLAKEESNKREILARGGLGLVAEQLKTWSTAETKHAMAFLQLLAASEREYSAILKADQTLISALTDIVQTEDSEISQEANLLLQTVRPSTNLSTESSGTTNTV